MESRIGILDSSCAVWSTGYCQRIVTPGGAMEVKLIIGMGKSGLACAKKMLEMGHDIVVYDKNARKVIRQSEWEDVAKKWKIRLLEDDWKLKDVEAVDEAIISPGVPTDLPLVDVVRQLGIPIVGEIELAYRFIKAPMVGITGTNGKTTTTTLVYEIFKESGSSVYLAGNIGYPLMDLVDLVDEDDLVVVELSSFQLESIDDFRVKLGMILNITPDHLDRHHTMDAYIDAKMNIFKNCDSMDFALLNREDPLIQKASVNLKCRILYFSTKGPVKDGAFVAGERIMLSRDNETLDLMGLNELKVPGIHNVQNILAAAAGAFFMGVPVGHIRSAIRKFGGVEHRIEYVGSRNGVFYYNDSKGTNTDAGIIALKAMNAPVVLIAGGYDKNADYKEWIQQFHGRVKKVFLIGETAAKIKEQALQLDFTDVEICSSLEEAVKRSAQTAQTGDAVLLSPACASWDMFENYEVRGTRFKELVEQL
ncbi:UDP-N-acetylmuramoyl-L-alanine--D-glutamate ligase [Alkalibacter rhizosphaerae]|uniref:UDP-N-acetylmuramoylalanine--D-glutamate ligase n=1 Tax=Alkalibacter rhizosphaerae TaxID=2815577 RepID=A0A974XFQ7_9FIRM|nr:UDP-N-acetylmuramoyl-L-alanine--D-glutamate ligase [Alkalibacter rhizosphaerae]QSX08921.1 UDP-N-acetylmuramoyl-L-alanine--D-glutamate ligase [Alkalibacter rhizosphaerae]